ncbi:MAG: D-cysteine desulfhydrase [Solirubrobacteraceae bacterium]|nr:D-cysteine desulfhydrase [Solirubrobacteraceae bacterium]
MIELDLPRVRLHDGGPTPVRAVRSGLWLKADGEFGSGGWGGNKVRKLEWLLGEAQARGRKRILTFGGRGTNWGLATALYARSLDIETILALVDQPMDDRVIAQFERLRNSGARIHLTRSPWRTRLALPRLWLRHGRPWVLPAGGSTPVGAVGYVEAGLEIGAQVQAGVLPEPDRVVVAVGSGATLAGLVIGLQAAGLRSRVLGVVVNDQLPLGAGRLAKLAQACAELLGKRGADLGPLDLGEGAFDLTRDYLGDGYGHPTEAGAEAVRATGLDLDPIYTAKAMAAALALPGPTLFIHTDGPR